MHFSWTLIKHFDKKSFSVLRGSPLNTLKLLWAKCFINCLRKCIIYKLKFFLLMLSNYVIFHCIALKVCITQDFFLMKMQKQGFPKWKKENTDKNKIIKIKFQTDLVIQLLILFVFKEILWLISVNWCFQKNIALGLAMRWSDTP